MVSLSLLPTFHQLSEAVAVGVMALALATVGAAVAGKPRLSELDLLFGWAVALVLFLLVATLTTLPVSVATVAVVLGGPLVWAFARRFGVAEGLPWGRGAAVLVLCLPLLLLVAGTQPSEWDEFANWLPSAQYLLAHHMVPGEGRPLSTSVFPAYPYALNFLIYSASLMHGALVPAAGALFNTLFLLVFAGVTARAVAAPFQANGQSWTWLAFGALLVTAFNPTFVPKVMLTAYADTPIVVAVAVAAFLGVRLLGVLAEGAAGAKALAWQMGLVLTVLVGVKQIGLGLAAVLLGALAVLAWRLGVAKVFARQLPLMLVLPGVAVALWRTYVDRAMTASCELGFRPLTDWAFHLTPDILGSMANVALNKGGYFGMMLVVLAVAALARPDTPGRRLAWVAAVLFVAYNAFLFVAYLGSFDPYEAARAASYWRYNLHLGGVALLAFAVLVAEGLARRGWNVPDLAAKAGVVLLVLAPLVAAPQLRFDRHPVKDYLRAIAPQVAAQVPPGATLAVADPNDPGFYSFMLQFLLGPDRRMVARVDRYQTWEAPRLAEHLARSGAGYLWVHQTNPVLDEVVGRPLNPAASHLLEWGEEGWRLLASWPYPGYTDPTTVSK